MRLRVSGAIAVAALAVLLGLGKVGRADTIPYPAVGTPNTALYTFTAAADGDIIAYFAGTGAGFDLRLGLQVNGILTNAGLAPNQSSAIGQSFNFGPGSSSASSPGFNGSAGSSFAGSTTPTISSALSNLPASSSSSNNFEIGSSDPSSALGE
jgi:hypothetical protein